MALTRPYFQQIQTLQNLPNTKTVIFSLNKLVVKSNLCFAWELIFFWLLKGEKLSFK